MEERVTTDLETPELPEGYFFEVGEYFPRYDEYYYADDFYCPIVWLKCREVSKKFFRNKEKILTVDSIKMTQKIKGTKSRHRTEEPQELNPRNVQKAMLILKERHEERVALKAQKDALHGEYPPKKLKA